MHRWTTADAKAAGRLGGLTSGPIRRRKAALRAAAQLGQLIPDDMRARFGARDLARVQALLVRAFLKGTHNEGSARRMRETAQRRRTQKKEAA
jgi:hypothetical protein